MSALWTALMEGETKESLATMVCERRARIEELEKALRKIEAAQHEGDEVMVIETARAALKETP